MTLLHTEKINFASLWISFQAACAVISVKVGTHGLESRLHGSDNKIPRRRREDFLLHPFTCDGCYAARRRESIAFEYRVPILDYIKIMSIFAQE
jgi:hypothetical protein